MCHVRSHMKRPATGAGLADRLLSIFTRVNPGEAASALLRM